MDTDAIVRARRRQQALDAREAERDRETALLDQIDEVLAELADDPQDKAREMLLEHADPEFGPYIWPGIVPKLTRTPGALRWSATWEEGSHNAEVYGGLLGLSDDELTAVREEGVI